MTKGRLWPLVFLLAGCASSRPRQPGELRQTALVMTFHTQGLLTSFADEATSAALIQEGRPDTVIFSNYRREDRLYFLDLPPGRYLPVAVYWTAHGLRHGVKLTEEDQKGTLIATRAGEVRFIGDFTAKRRWEDWPRFLLNGLRSAKILLPPFRPAVALVDAPVKVHDTSVEAETRVMREALKDLSGTEWMRGVRARLAAIKAPPVLPTETRGFFRREVSAAVHWTPAFGWYDTLEWGEPLDIPGGLEWRHPKKEARVQVSLRQEPPLAEALERLKGFGSSEDLHTHQEISLSTRPAYSVTYTSYHYPEPYLTGAVVKVSTTETLLVPDAKGYWIVQMRAERSDFAKLRKDFVRFRELLRLEPPPKVEPRPKEEE